jgi:hypothetical protein
VVTEQVAKFWIYEEKKLFISSNISYLLLKQDNNKVYMNIGIYIGQLFGLGHVFVFVSLN